MTRNRAIAIAALGSVALLSGCSDLFASRYRFHLTVEVDTPQGVRTGSSVLEVSSSKNSGPLIGEEHQLSTGITGEAVAVDIATGRTLFALISDLPNGGGLEGEVTKLFEPSAVGPDAFVKAVGKLGRSDQVGRSAALPTLDYPMLVTFSEIHDPSSIQLVKSKDLAEIFGPGVKIRRITVTITDDAETSSIDQRLPWYDYHNSKRLRLNGKTGAVFTDELSDNLDTSSFRRGDD